MPVRLPVRGEKFIVRKVPTALQLIDGKRRGEFFVGEEVTFAYYSYNHYDGCPMFFFEPRQDGREVVWIGDYDDTQESMLARWEEHFTSKVE